MEAVQRATFMRSLRAPKFRRRMVVLVAVAGGLVFAALLAIGETIEGAAVGAATGVISGLVGVVLLLAAVRLLLPRRSRRWFRQQRSLHHEQTVTWSADGLHQRSERAHSHYPWSEFLGWTMTPEVMLIFSNEISCYFVPRRALAPGDAEAMVAIVEAAGLPRR
jgi:hypothetical protein